MIPIINDRDKNNLIGAWNKKLEFEIRIQNLNKTSFNKITEFFSERNLGPPKTSISRIYEGGYRSMEEDGKVILMKKTNIKNIDNPYLKLKFSLAEEKVMAAIPTDVLQVVRERTRNSAKWGNFVIDITHVKQSSGNTKPTERYEVEIEYAGDNLFKDFNDRFYQLINSIIEIRDKIKDIYTFYNNVLSGKKFSNKSNDIDLRYISRPRDMTFHDLVGKGILQGYVAGVKASGELKYLITHEKESWIVFPNKEDIYLGNDIFPDESIFVGEFISDLNLFLIFDVLCFDKENTSNKNYLDRIKYAEEVYKHKTKISTEIGILYVQVKDYVYLGKTSETFYEAMNKILDIANENKDYENDGIIFTPNESGYITEGQGKKFSSLDKLKDVVKHKPIELLSIDLLYTDHKLFAQPNIMVYDFRADNENAKIIFELKGNYKYGDIIEFFPTKEDDKIKYLSDRTREDKETPNSYYIFEDHQRIFSDPITKDTLRGKNTKLMFKYHNRIKKEIYGNKKGVLIDFGSGKGGDIAKWKNFSHILAIEPNEEYLEEFRKRLNSNYEDMKDKISILTSGGEETEKIKNFVEENKEHLEHQPLYISFMLSLTFFWKDNKIMLKDLAKTIKEIEKIYKSVGGEKITILYFVLDGNKIKPLEGDNLTLKVNNEDVFIDIKDSKIVHDQVEYKVFLNDLWKLTKFKVEKEFNADREELLSKIEKEYSGMFVYGEADKFLVEKDYTTTPLIVINEIYEGKVVGDDKVENLSYLDEHLFRLAVIYDQFTFKHSLSKLLNEKYRNDQTYSNRMKIVEHYKENLNIGVIIFRGDEVIEILNEQADEFVFLNETKNGTFEPVIYIKDDNYFYSFDRKSRLLKNIL